MKTLVQVVVAAVCFVMVGAVVAHAAERQDVAYTGSQDLERMKQLVGVWGGISDKEHKGQPIKVVYRLTAGGSAVVETLFPGTAEEMVSVYHDQKGKLVMTHYCMLHNQPRMTLKKANAQVLEFMFAEGNDINPAKDPHMHALSITFVDNDHIVQKWTMFENGKEQGETVLKLSRVR